MKIRLLLVIPIASLLLAACSVDDPHCGPLDSLPAYDSQQWHW